MDELDQKTQKLIDHLDQYGAVTPRPEWTESVSSQLQNLRSKSVTKSSTIGNTQHSVFNFIYYFTNMQRKHFIALAAGAVAFSLITAGAAGGAYYWQKNRQGETTALQFVSYSEAQKREIFEGMLTNNDLKSAENAKVSNTAVSFANAEASGKQAASSDMSILPYWEVEEEVLITTKYTGNFGPAVDRCEMYKSFGAMYNGTVSEGVSYARKGENNYNHSRYTTKLANGTVISYNLNTVEGDKMANYTYSGGKYAIKNVFSYGDIMYPEGMAEETMLIEENLPSPQTDPLEYIKYMYSPDADIIGEQRVDGTDYYVVEYKSSLYCDPAVFEKLASSSYIEPTTEVNNTDTVRLYINKQTFVVEINEEYLGEPQPENLVSQSKTQESRQPMAESQALSRFKFDINTEVKTIEYPEEEKYDYIAEAEKVVEYITKNSETIVVPASFNKVSYVGIEGYNQSKNDSDQYFDYYQDRDFYPSGSVGDELYKMATQWSDSSYSQSWMNGNSVSVSDNERYYDMQVFKAANDAQKAFDAMSQWDPTATKSESTRNVRVNGVVTPAKVRSFTSTSVYINEGGESVTETFTNHIALVNTPSASIIINFGDNKSELLDTLDLTVYNSSNSAELEQMSQIIRDVAKRNMDSITIDMPTTESKPFGDSEDEVREIN